ncbi:hypothetical protein [Antarctobacter sp.]|uniref:hypothetical protein n=1 Tax=Antarctobacter sp. TaxID=1872577 RepID=UPI003A8CA91E
MACEQIPPGEAADIRRLIRHNLRTLWQVGGVIKRGQHGKHHGLLEGVFRVSEQVPEALAHGIFRPGAEYACRVRFSNGGQRDDREKDVRGMAVKLLNVPGVKLLPGQGHVMEQDFVLVDHPTYFCANMKDYLVFNRHFTPIQALRGNGPSLGRLLRAARGGVMLALFHRSLLRAAQDFAGRRVGSVLALTYHSTTAYRLGKGAVKYKAIGHGAPAAPTEQADGLRDGLWQAQTTGEARFTFGVVPQVDPARQPVEDASSDWEAAGADFVPLADILLPAQQNSPQQDAEAESLRFSPWMCQPEHRPLGAINRARRDIYRAMAQARRD